MPALSAAARTALAKIARCCRRTCKTSLDTSSLLIGPGKGDCRRRYRIAGHPLGDPKRAQAAHPLSRQATARDSRRTIWPFALGFFERVRVVVAWCEMREDFRHFRTDRISKVQVTDKRYPRRRQMLLKDWRAGEGIRGKIARIHY